MPILSEKTKYLRSKIQVDEKFNYLLKMAIWFDKQGRPTITFKGKNIKLWYFMLDKKQGVEIDHKDGNFLNNKLNNLRYVTRSQNMFNRKKLKTSTQIYKGIQKLPSGKFRAKGPNGVHWGTFLCPVEAYNKFLKNSKICYGEQFVIESKNI